MGNLKNSSESRHYLATYFYWNCQPAKQIAQDTKEDKACNDQQKRKSTAAYLVLETTAHRNFYLGFILTLESIINELPNMLVV